MNVIWRGRRKIWKGWLWKNYCKIYEKNLKKKIEKFERYYSLHGEFDYQNEKYSLSKKKKRKENAFGFIKF